MSLCFPQWDVYPTYLLVPEGVAQGAGFSEHLLFYRLGTQSPEGEERKRLLQGSCQISLKCVDRRAEKEGGQQPDPTCQEVARLLGVGRGGRQSDRVVVGSASLLPLKTSFIISR